MTDPKPVSYTYVATAPGDYEPEPVVIVGALPAGAIPTAAIASYLTGLTGYSAGATQTLKNVTGTLTWVTDV